jgi:hypothetical protein
MRVQQLVLFISASVMGGLAAQSAVAQDYRGSQEEQMACTPDVWRLCGAQIPDVNRITACLRANGPQLSPPCRAVMQPAAQREPERRRRGRQTQPQTPYDDYDDQ